MDHDQRFQSLVITTLGQSNVNKVNFFLPYLKFMKRPQTNFQADTMNHSAVIWSKIVKICHYVKIYH